jgi:hypothetical protein
MYVHKYVHMYIHMSIHIHTFKTMFYTESSQPHVGSSAMLHGRKLFIQCNRFDEVILLLVYLYVG